MIETMGLLSAAVVLAQAMAYPAGERAPTLDETRAGMGIPSIDLLRGRRDSVGYAATAEQMQSGAAGAVTSATERPRRQRVTET